MTSNILTTALSAFLIAFTVPNVHAGSIMGEVKFTDAAPKLAPINVSKDQDYCGETLPVVLLHHGSHPSDRRKALRRVILRIVYHPGNLVTVHKSAGNGLSRESA